MFSQGTQRDGGIPVQGSFLRKKINKNGWLLCMFDGALEMLHCPEHFQAQLRVGYFVFRMNASFLFVEI